jgi:maltooligosyltrehalose trehalohydrolase
LENTFVFTGQYSSFRKRSFGDRCDDRPPSQFVVFSQNHDQVGNRVCGDRLSQLVPFEALKLISGMVMLSPFIPMLFMGEEYGEENPFLYFVDHADTALLKAVRDGRRREFREQFAVGEPPDPDAPASFEQSRLDWERRSEGKHAALLSWYRAVINVRKTVPSLAIADGEPPVVIAAEDKKYCAFRRGSGNDMVWCYGNFSDRHVQISSESGGDIRCWRLLLDSADTRWGGPGSLNSLVRAADGMVHLPPFGFVVYRVLGE